MEEHKVIDAMRPDAPPRKREKIFLRVWFEWVMRQLMSIRLAVWLLIVMGVTMVVGSIFPQGYGAETYIASWGEGRYEVLSRFGLLNLFHTKYFLLLGIILLLNLVICSIVRLYGRRGVSASTAVAPPGARVIDMEGDADAALTKAVRALTERGYYVSKAAGGVVTARRGPWPEGISLLYHLAMALAILGFILSALHSFEGDVTLYPGEPVAVRTMSTETGWQKFRHGVSTFDVIGWYPFDAARPDTNLGAGRDVTLTLNEFITEWELYQDKYYPRDWISDLQVHVVGHGPEVDWPSRRIEVNRPLRAGGLTFYQMAYEQEFDVVVLQGGEEVERVRANAYVPFTLESIDGMFFPGTMRVGTLYQKYHPTQPVVPHVPLKWQPPTPEVAEVEPEETTHAAPETTDATGENVRAEAESSGVATAEADTAAPPPPPPERIEIGDLSAEEPLEHEGFTLMLENPYEGSVLTYRHDPGVLPLYIAITAFILGLAVRTYWPSYRVNLWLESTAAGARGRLVFRATGILGEPEAVEDELVAELGKETTEPEPPEEGATEAPPAAPGTPPPSGRPTEHAWKPGSQPLRDALPSDPAAPDEPGEPDAPHSES